MNFKRFNLIDFRNLTFKATTMGNDLSMKMGKPASQGPRPSTSKGLRALVISKDFLPIKEYKNNHKMK